MKFMDNLIRFWSYFRRDTLCHYIDLELNSDHYTFVTKTGALMTMIKIEGLGQIAGTAEFIAIKKAMSVIFQGSFLNDGHVIQMTHERDFGSTRNDVINKAKSSRKTSKIIGVDFDDIFDENEDVLSNYCTYEDTYLAVWTTTAVLSPEVVKKARERNGKIKKDFPYDYADGVDVFRYIKEMQNKHEAFVDTTIIDNLRRAGAVVEKLTAHNAGAVIRNKFDREGVHSSWVPSLIGDKHVSRDAIEDMEDIPKKDVSDLMWPRLDWQLARQNHEPHKPGILKIGTLFYKTLFVDVPPDSPERFGQLANKIDPDIPFRISYHFGKVGSFELSVKTQLNAFLAWAHTENRQIARAVARKQADSEAGHLYVNMQIAVTTWSNDENVLNKNTEKLTRALQSWGNLDVEIDITDETEGFVSTIPGVSMRSPAALSYPPVGDATHMLPLARPASLWDSGGVLFRTPDGKLYPYEVQSSKQELTVDLFVAPPRQGKSVLSNALNKALCLRQGQSELPYLCVLDIGPSSLGMIDLLLDALPPHLKHLAVHHKMKESSEHSINPFDLQLGCSAPLANERSFQMNLFTQLLTPVGSETPTKDMMELVSMLIKHTYEYYSKQKTAKGYNKRINDDIDQMLVDRKISLLGDPTWLEVRDALFNAGEYEMATIAQRYSVPLLTDFAGRVYDDTIVRSYGNVTNKENELLEEFSRRVNENIREYPLFSQPTKISFDNARIIAIDLQDVTEEGSPAADKKTGIMYLLGRYLGAKSFYLTEDDVRYFRNDYQKYQKDRIQKIRRSVKRLVFDEFHKTAKQQGVRLQVIKDMREGGKWGVGVALLSQEPTDFDKTMINLATNRFFMGGLAKQAQDDVISLFGLTDVEASILREPGRLHGPKAHAGSCMLLKTKYDGFEYSQLVNFQIGSKELWSYSTSFTDIQIKNALKEALGSKRAREVLAKYFPSGSASKEIERRNKLQSLDDDITDSKKDGVLTELINELLAMALEEDKFSV
jgi:intracellular multiplication protein IcmB